MHKYTEHAECHVDENTAHHLSLNISPNISWDLLQLPHDPLSNKGSMDPNHENTLCFEMIPKMFLIAFNVQIQI